MALTTHEQVKRLIEKAEKILICFGAHGSGDAIATSLALLLFLKSLGKEAEIVSDDFKLPSNYKFLPHAAEISGALPPFKQYIIKADARLINEQNLKYDIKNNELEIFITPRAASLRKENFIFTEIQNNYDLIFVIDTPDFNSLGQVYTQNTELFYTNPLVVIDNDPSNEQFGQINVVELNSTSAAEVLYHLIEQINPEKLDKDIATCILTGMIAETRSFKSPHITPHTLSVASRLVEKGADREQIVDFLYRTRRISTLKLWGRALSRLESAPEIGLAWTSVTHDDFIHSNAAEHELPEIVNELISNTPQVKVSAVFYECPGEPQKVCALVSSERQFDAKLLTKPFEPVGTKNQVRLEFKDKTLQEVKELVIGNIKKLLSVV